MDAWMKKVEEMKKMRDQKWQFDGGTASPTKRHEIPKTETASSPTPKSQNPEPVKQTNPELIKQQDTEPKQILSEQKKIAISIFSKSII